MSRWAEVDLPWSADAPAQARLSAQQQLSAWEAQVEVGPVELLVSELATNGYRHGGPPLSLMVELSEHRLWVGVSDGGGGRPAVLEPHLHAEDGRGLQLLNGLASRWGVGAGTEVRVVWFEVRTWSLV